MNKKEQAQQLYMNSCMTQKEIAAAVGITERTLYTWIHQYMWDKLRLAAFQAPITIADNICSQLVELQNAIARKQPGCRYPDPAEAETMRKLIVMLEKMKKTPSLSQTMQVLETFRNYMRPVDKDFTRQLAAYTDRFLTGKSVNGYAPYQAEYGVDPVPPMSTCYDEVDDPGAPVPVQPCPDINTCLHEGNCTYPKCLHPERYEKPVDPVTHYRISPLHYQQPQAGMSTPDDTRDSVPGVYRSEENGSQVTEVNGLEHVNISGSASFGTISFEQPPSLANRTCLSLQPEKNGRAIAGIDNLEHLKYLRGEFSYGITSFTRSLHPAIAGTLSASE